ncbi:response regulator receiver protein [Halothece sp. PCC 7418]|uniref:response regulator n=1 Tax=Halothece sp. (strain PCC 7418) TaxID=65093 RepID=UPI0002A07C49|nr:response regulator [Halothece sp. PCC 7418]AFZ44195.1 response regulator receiver protein [Halothece sp. PCC 7418]
MSISNQPKQLDSSKRQILNNPFQLLASLSQLQHSGKLTVFTEEVSWEIYVANRQLQAAFISVQSLESLYYHLQALNYKTVVSAVKTAIKSSPQNHSFNHLSIKKTLDWLKQQNLLNSEQISQVTQQISLEAIEPFFWLDHGTCQWQEMSSTPITTPIADPPQLIDLVKQGRDRIQSWQELLDQIQSPYQRPYLFNHSFVENSSERFLAKLSRLMRGFSIHQIALLIQQDEIHLAKKLYPYLQSKDLILREANSPWKQLPSLPQKSQNHQNPEGKKKQKRSLIACVDDSPTILREVQRFLGKEEYEIIKIENPVEAASTLFRVKPNLILMDISMPEINGYQLCGLLKNSKALSQVPIIMVTSRTGMIDKVRAKASGATDYLTKPFTQDSLLEIVRKYL